MSFTSLARKAGRVEYSLLRAPLHALDGAASRYLPADSPVRTMLERGVGALDAAAARVLAVSGPVRAQSSPASRTVRVETAETASGPLPAAASGGGSGEAETADSGPTDLDSGARVAQNVAPPEEVELVAAELRATLDHAPLVGELAEAGEDDKQQMADLRARHIVEEHEAQQRAKHARFQQS